MTAARRCHTVVATVEMRFQFWTLRKPCRRLWTIRTFSDVILMHLRYAVRSETHVRSCANT